MNTSRFKCPECETKMKYSISSLYSDMAIINIYCPDCDTCFTMTYNGKPFYEKYNSDNRKEKDGYGMPEELS